MNVCQKEVWISARLSYIIIPANSPIALPLILILPCDINGEIKRCRGRKRLAAMGDKLLNTTQVINGLAVLLSFFVGYKYAIKRNIAGAFDKNRSDGAGEDTVHKNILTYGNNYKMVLVVRNDLKMGKGKIAAQCCHGAVGAYQKSMKTNPALVRAWENTGCAKVALKVESEPELIMLKRSAERNGLNTCLIRDAGRTQIEPNSITMVAIGPGRVEDIDKVTGHLKLL